MELTFQVIFIIIAILIVLSIWFLIIKYFLYPLFFKPELNLIETFDFFKSKNLVFIEKRELKKAEMKINPFNYKSGLSFKKMFSERSEYVVVGYSKSKREYYFFWLELNQWYSFHMKFFIEILTGEKIERRRNLIFKEITEKEVLTELKKKYESQTVLITDKCPACHNRVSDKITECPNCGLNLVA
ncbi:hypothetical protein [Flavobacterium sp.]|uniref:hypothetical protein n=2 Tax=Flavobacterium sp. TaxID=239 RepID=UPI0025C5FCD7|nr:hypothetical protein [Flavobacterium sp.]